VTPVAAGCPRSGRTVLLRLTLLSLAQARLAVLRLGPPKLERQRFVEWPVSQCAAQPSAENRRMSFRPLNRAQKVRPAGENRTNHSERRPRTRRGTPPAECPGPQRAVWYFATTSAGMRPRSETFSPCLRAHSRIA